MESGNAAGSKMNRVLFNIWTNLKGTHLSTYTPHFVMYEFKEIEGVRMGDVYIVLEIGCVPVEVCTPVPEGSSPCREKPCTEYMSIYIFFLYKQGKQGKQGKHPKLYRIWGV